MELNQNEKYIVAHLFNNNLIVDELIYKERLESGLYRFKSVSEFIPIDIFLRYENITNVI